MFKALKEKGIQKENCLYLAEHTGGYSELLCIEMAEISLDLWMVSSLELKLNSGLQRGKSDPLDAFRLADFR